LSPDADAVQVRAAFRKLAKLNHPDVSHSRRSQRRFVEVVRAYHILRQRLRSRPTDRDWGACPRCGVDGDLFKSLSGGSACADCLLGMTRKRRFLPLPLFVIARHVSVIALYAASIALLIRYHESHTPADALISLACVVLGLLLLALEVLRVAWRDAAARRAAR